jgi:hypothetical protein
MKILAHLNILRIWIACHLLSPVNGSIRLITKIVQNDDENQIHKFNTLIYEYLGSHLRHIKDERRCRDRLLLN